MGEQFTVAVKEIALTYQKTLMAVGILIQRAMIFICAEEIMKIGELELNKIHCMDCLGGMKKLPDNSVDSIVTDPPYELGFMGKSWDSTGVAYNVEIWKEALRVLKPGGHLLAFGGTRTYHRMACAIEDAGFEIRDQMQWLYGSGFPKSLNIGKQIDKMNGKKQEEFTALGKYLKEARGNIPQNQISKFFPSKTGGLTGCVSNWEKGSNVPTKKQWIILKEKLDLNNEFDYIIEREEAEREIIGKNDYTIPKEVYNIGQEKSGERDESLITAPATEEAKEWEGWGTALKPANEPICVARKPLSEKNVALNVLKWRTGGINIDDSRIGTTGARFNGRKVDSEIYGKYGTSKPKEDYNKGRFPANIILDEEAGDMLGKQKRFFYCAKASKSERGESNNHPTVKPLKLMKYLVKLVTKKGGIVLDPFSGSGTTCLASQESGMKFIGFELSEEYCQIANKRLEQDTLEGFK